MPALFSVTERAQESDMCFSNLVQQDAPTAKNNSMLIPKVTDDFHSPILPGLPDDVSKHCLALVPRSHFPAMGAVCKRWRSFLKSKEFITVRKLAGVLEEWLYVLTADAEGDGSHWEVLYCLGHKHHQLPPMPGPAKAGFGVVVLNGKLLVIAGYSVVDGTGSVSPDLYQYDSCLNSWSKLASMNVGRYDFACAEVNGLIYAVGGCGADGESLSCAEVYNPETDKWTVIESLRRPRWGCFACGVEGKLYVMGGRSSFTIGNSRFVDMYSPERHTWCQMKNGCVMVTAHAVLGKKLCCMEWNNERKLAIFNPEDNSWKRVPVPVTGSSSIGFRFGTLDGKLLLFSLQEDPGYRTLLYDPNAAPGSEWQTSGIKPSGLCLCAVTRSKDSSGFYTINCPTLRGTEKVTSTSQVFLVLNKWKSPASTQASRLVAAPWPSSSSPSLCSPSPSPLGPSSNSPFLPPWQFSLVSVSSYALALTYPTPSPRKTWVPAQPATGVRLLWHIACTLSLSRSIHDKQHNPEYNPIRI